MTDTVWLLFDHGDLRGVYADEATARTDGRALVARIAEESGEPVRDGHIEVLPQRVHTAQQWDG